MHAYDELVWYDLIDYFVGVNNDNNNSPLGKIDFHKDITHAARVGFFPRDKNNVKRRSNALLSIELSDKRLERILTTRYRKNKLTFYLLFFLIISRVHVRTNYTSQIFLFRARK